MKKLVFNFHLCLLITTFIFVATPAMAAPVEIDVAGEWERDAGEFAIKLTYNTDPDPEPTIDDLVVTAASTSVTFTPVYQTDVNEELVRDANGELIKVPKQYQITLTYTPPAVPNPINFTLRGYEEFDVFAAFVASQGQPFSGVTLTLAADHLAGLGYAIIAANATAIANNVYPTLPLLVAPNTINKIAWSAVSSETAMPDLHDLFRIGGTLNLRVNVPGTTDRLGSKQADDTYDDDHNRNQRQVVINEVMWAHDQSYLGVPASLVQEQWIELYNRTTTPIAYADIRLSTSKQDPAPPAETDRLSNVPSYVNTWVLTNIGQHGSSITPRREFKSMERIDLENGWDQDHWRTSTNQFLRYYFGSPGAENRISTVRAPRTPPGKDTPAKNKIIINEIGNLTNNELDWIELQNVTGSAQSLHNWALTKTIGVDNETEIIRFPNYSIEPRGRLLLVNRHPHDTLISLGFDIKFSADDQEFGAGPHKFLVLDDDKLEIPNDDGWLLILRSRTPWDVGESRNVYQTGFRVEDVAGPGALHDNFVVQDLTAPTPIREKKADGQPTGEIWNTKVFPLNGNMQPDADFLQSDRLNSAGKVWVRDGTKQGFLKDAWSQAVFTGIGYDRKVQKNNQNSGTPGYDNNIAKGKISQLDGGSLIISELMLSTGTKNLPQWIELYNTSKTRAIDLAADSSQESEDQTGWQIIIENHESGSWKEFKRNLNITINLKDLFTYIPPNQTVLIASTIGKNPKRDYFPDARVAGIFQEKATAFSMANKKDAILNAEGGFYIKIVDGDGTVSDEIGNLDGQAANLRSRYWT